MLCDIERKKEDCHREDFCTRKSEAIQGGASLWIATPPEADRNDGEG